MRESGCGDRPDPDLETPPASAAPEAAADGTQGSEAGLRERERLLREMLEEVDAFISIRHAQGGRFSLSPSVERILGYAPEELAPFGAWRALVHPDDLDRVLAIWSGPEDAWELEYRVRRADQSWAWVRERGRRSLDEEGRRGRLASVITDVTAARAQREGLLRSIRLESLGRLASGVAHDFDNVLYGIAMLAQMAARSVGDGPAAADVTAIVEATERGRELTRRLLELAGSGRLAPVRLDPADPIRAAAAAVEPSLGDAVVLDVAIRPDLPPLLVDRAGLERSLVELLVAARDSMPRGGWVTLVAETAEVDEIEAARADLASGRYLRIAIEDGGVGIGPEMLDHLFDPFYAASPESIGTALGLPLVHAFVRASGGGIAVESEIGTGTIVRLYLPPAPTSAERDERDSAG